MPHSARRATGRAADTGYDVIVVGAGTAGCVVAAACGRDPRCRVLLLEAGGSDRRPGVVLPAVFPLALAGRLSWRDTTEAQQGLGGRRVPLHQGRVLGGSSGVNAMIHRSPLRSDVDGWRATGATGFGWDELRPFLAPSERTAPEALRDPHELSCAFVAAARSRVGADPDGGGFRDAGLHAVTQRRGRRWSAADASLRGDPAPGLTVVTGAEVTRIVLEGTRAVGVEYRHGSRVRRARADAEVVLCAGALRSPLLLQRSGVGPADELAAAGVPPVVDLPVGVGLQDHPLVLSTWSLRRGVAGLHSPLAAPWLWARHRRGLLTSNGTEAGATAVSDARLAVPDLHLHAAPAALLGRTLSPAATRGFTVATALLAPRSRGRVVLRGPDTRDPPRVDPGHLSDGRDLDALAVGVRLADEVAREHPLADLLAARRHPRTAPDDDAALRERVRRDAVSLYHPASGCALGTVLDDDHRVRGVDRLRVVDAAALPAVPRTHPQALVTALAARAAARLVDGASTP